MAMNLDSFGSRWYINGVGGVGERDLTRTSSSSKPISMEPEIKQTGKLKPVAAVTRNGGADLRVFGVLVAIRLANALLTPTFHPDEYYETLEPAWQMAFGRDSGAWISWKWDNKLHSSLAPPLFAMVYMLVDNVMWCIPYAYVVRPYVLIWTPKIVQAVLAASSDWFTWKLARRIYGDNENVSWVSLYLMVVNPYHWYHSVRSSSSSLETTLTAAALSYWPWQLLADPEPVKENPGKRDWLQSPEALRSLRVSVVLATLSAVLRLTNLPLWVTVWTLCLSKHNAPSSSSSLLKEILGWFSATVAVSRVSDRLYYGAWTLPAYNWLSFNASKSTAVFVGLAPWHHYLSVGFPVLSGVFLPFIVRGLYRSPPAKFTKGRNQLLALAASAGATVFALTWIPHKDTGFIYPLLPVLTVLGAPHVELFFSWTAEATKEEPKPKPIIVRRGVLVVAILLNVTAAGYFSLYHHRAPVAGISALRKLYEESHPTVYRNPWSKDAIVDEGLFAQFIMPCHSTPWRSQLIYPGLRARAPTCDPPVHLAPNSAELAEYRHETDRVYDDIMTWLGGEVWPAMTPEQAEKAKRTGTSPGIPPYVVGFQSISTGVRIYFEHYGRELGIKPEKVWRGWNGVYNWDWRRGGDLMIWSTGSKQKRVA